LSAKPFFVLAPMDDVTDSVFRRVVTQCAPPDLYFTEFANVDGLQSPGRSRLLKKLQHTKIEQPLIAQIWGLTPDNYYKTAQQIADGSLAGEFAGIDINMGCPDKSIVKNGSCSALISDPERAVEIIKAVQAGAGKLPVSVKTRLGSTAFTPEWHETLLKQNLDMLTIHGRTRAEMSKVPAQWEKIGQIRAQRDKIAPQTKLVGNGDVMSRPEGLALAAEHGLDGIMIGRGVFQDPFIFAENSPWETYTKQQRLELFKMHVCLFMETWQHNERPVHTLNKFCKIYINGFDGAKELREIFMNATSAEELLKAINEVH
jgi:tRNA-dihydrouridine synthase